MPGYSQVAWVILNLTAVFWGIWLLLPFSVFDSSPSYYIMSQTLAESAWGVIGIGLGVMSTIAVLSQERFMTRVASFALAGLWAVCAATFIIANPVSSIIPIWVCLAALNGYLGATTRL